MKLVTLAVAAFVVLLGGAGHATAGLLMPKGMGPSGPEKTFTFTFQEDLALLPTGSGTLHVRNSGLGDGSFWVTSGTLTINLFGGITVGTYTLVPLGPSVTLSPNGSFLADNLIYPLNNAASGVNPGPMNGNPSYLTNWGLVFAPGGSNPGIIPELNIYGNGANDYGFLGGEGPGEYIPWVPLGNQFTLTPAVVPEPSIPIMLVTGIAGLGYFGWRRRKLAVA